jgi:hypothetical protein
MGSIPVVSYGNLPQLGTFEGGACVPTAFTNTLAALARTNPKLSRLIGTNGTYADLEETRGLLGKEYFRTSRSWQPAGSPASLVVSGTQDYLRSVDLAELLEIRAIGPGPNDALSSLANFGITQNVRIVPAEKGKAFTVDVTTPKFRELLQRNIYKKGSTKIDDIKNALDSGKGLVLALFYDSLPPAGHAVSAVSLQWEDKNNNGLADEEENATLTIIDPLDPSTSYSQNFETPATDTFSFDPLVQSTGGVKSSELILVSKADGSLSYKYKEGQSSLVVTDSGLFDRETDFDASNPDADGSAGSIVFAAILSTRKTVGDKVIGTPQVDVIELDPGRNKIKGAGAGDVFVVGDPLSLEQGRSDIITDFRPGQNDTIGLRSQELQIEDKTFIRIDSRRELDRAAKSEASLIYLEAKTYGILYSNQNGEEPGFGINGGELIRLQGSPNLGINDIALI